MKPGQTATFTFPAPGTYHYQCSFHPQNMKGTVVVDAP
jgi:plastocyanin